MPEFEKLVDKDTWNVYCDSVSDHAKCIGYLNANEHFAETLNDMLSKDYSFEELKAELTRLRDTRVEMINYALDHLP